MDGKIHKPFIGRRILSALIDYGIIHTFTWSYVIAIGTRQEDGSFSLSGALGFVPILFWFFMTVVLESGLGATIGNSLAGLHVVNQKNLNKVTFSSSLIRRLADPIDMFFFGIVGVVTIKNSRHHQRLGDLWADTIVVKKNHRNATQK